MASEEEQVVSDKKAKRTSQDSAFNGPQRMDGENLISRCFECSAWGGCFVRTLGEEIPEDCTLPKVKE